MQSYDHIIVGTGQATGTLVGGLPVKERIAIIEGNKIGGTCVNVGCTPTKALVASAKVAFMTRRAAEYGVMTADVSLDFSKVMQRMNSIRNGSGQGLEKWLNSLEHVDIYRDWAHFEDEKILRVGDKLIAGKNIYINTGGRAKAIPFEGLSEVSYLDNTSILELQELPEHLIVIGGSYIGLEFAQMFFRFGSRVTVLNHSGRIMSHEDYDVSDTALEILKEEGLQFELGVKIARVQAASQGGVEVVVQEGSSERFIAGSHLLIATGRVPNSDKLNLDAAGITTDKKGFIDVDDYCRTSVDGVFALGDVNGKGAFTHTSVNDAEIVLDTLRGGTRRLSDRVVTYAMFIDPPLGRVGLTEREALEKGFRVLKATRAMKTISRAKEMGETKGFVKLLVDAETDLILGATVFGVGGDEIVNMFTALMYSNLPCKTYRKAVLIHPTVSELMPWVLDNLQPVN